MNSIESKFPQYVATMVGIVFAISIGLFVFGPWGNPISAVAPIIGVILMLSAMVDYKRGLMALLLISGYLDFAKRLLLVNGDITFEDITKVLAVAPILAAGIFLGCYLPVVFRQRRSVGAEISLLISVALLEMLFIAATALQTRGFKETISTTGQSGIYIAMIAIGYSAYAHSSLEDIRRLFKALMFMFIPVAIYGLWQLCFGYSDLEVAYMFSGFTMTIALLLTDQLRPFSTMNSPQGYGTMMAFLAVLGFYTAITTKERRPMWVAFFLFYLVADLFSTQRGPAFLSITTIISLYWFSSVRKTIAIYVVGLSAIVLIILNARWLLNNLNWLDSLIPRGKSDLQGQLFGIGTFYDRLLGFVNVLGNPSAWTLLGDPTYDWKTSRDASIYNHDLLSSMLLRFGVLGLLVILAGAVIFLVVVHRRVLAVKDEERRKLAALLLNLVVSFLFLNMLGSVFQIFPLNLLIYLFTGVICVLCFPPLPRVPEGQGNPREPRVSARQGTIKRMPFTRPRPELLPGEQRP